MLSLLTLTGFAFGGFGGIGDDTSVEEDEYLYEQEGWAQTAAHPNLVEPLILNDALEPGPAVANNATPPAIFDIDRGETIAGFDPAQDQLELEYTASLGLPEITVTDFPDGTGASIALNGVAVADVPGAQGLNPNSINLIAV